eukprot:TRINITY_DN1648_c0_g1_i1.p1 TRINITY_DN1648_c0_g1~~TRINITY_DN1648_c0_g1_i1.p1  ORF type:complete len:295 (+),score=55.57 TRINITY_DN1648_c0_g1_i1:144-1028(+)
MATAIDRLDERLMQALTLDDVRGRVSSQTPSGTSSYTSSLASSPRMGRRKLQRDSLATRMTHGRPGSRRHQRFLNELYLRCGSEGGEVEPEWDLRLDWRSPFRLIFENSTMRERWELFRDVSEERQEQLLQILCKHEKPDTSSQHARRSRRSRSRSRDRVEEVTTDPERLYSRIQFFPRALLLKNWDNPAVVSMESELVNYLKTSEARTMNIYLPNTYLRILFRGICTYHKLRVTTSHPSMAPGHEGGDQDEDDDDSFLVVWRPRVVSIPPVLLAEYLQEIGRPNVATASSSSG